MKTEEQNAAEPDDLLLTGESRDLISVPSSLLCVLSSIAMRAYQEFDDGPEAKAAMLTTVATANNLIHEYHCKLLSDP